MMISNHIKQIHFRHSDPVDISGYCDGRDINFAHFFGVRIWEFDNIFTLRQLNTNKTLLRNVILF